MKIPMINFQDYLTFRKDDYAVANFKVLYNDLSNMRKDEVDDMVAEEYIKIFFLLYKDNTK